jgi:CheY-like chemotaxis protein
MPGMGGIEATQIIRKTLVAQPVIVALTANAFSEDKKKCLEAGMNEIITKPINKNELMAFLHSCKNKDHKN